MKTKLIAFLALASLTNLAGWAHDQNLLAPAISMPLGSVGYFQIDLEDDEQTVAFDAEIELPDGFEVLPKEDTPNRTQYVLNYERNEKMTFDASYPYKGNDSYSESYFNDVRLILMTADNSYIKGKTGWIVKLPMTTTAQLGTYEARIHSIHLTTKTYLASTNQTSYDEVDLPDITVKITVTEPEEIRYTDNQLFCKDIIINQGENTELCLFYNSNSDVYEYSTDIILPTNVTLDGEVAFSNALTAIENFTNNSSWNDTASKLTISGVYGGGRRDVPAPGGIQEIAKVKLNTKTLADGEYTIKVTKQLLSNDDDDYAPSEYIAKLIVKASSQKEKCSTPTISIINNQLFVHSDTEKAVYHTSIVAYDHKTVIHENNEPIELGGQYLVTSYASADGYIDSDPVTATLVWNKKDATTGTDVIDMETNRMLILQSDGDNIIISGIEESESIVLYDISGAVLYQGISDSNSFTIPFSCIHGQIYIVKAGSTTFKYLF